MKKLLKAAFRMKSFNLKAFTLIELVIVMAIMTVLLAGIMQLFAPVRVAYAETAALESKRATCNSITKYMTESLRYSQYIGVYETGATSASDAADKLYNSIDADNTALGLGFTPADLTTIKNNIQVIVIDYSEDAATTYLGQTYSGRLYRYNNGTGNEHMSFGKAYYGNNDFGINVKYDSAANSITVVASTQSFNSSGGAVSTTNEVVKTDGAAFLGNINSSTGGKFYSDTTSDVKKANGDSGQDGIADFLQDIGSTTITPAEGTLAASGSKYYFAFIPAEDMPY
jgi:prepilin-type N-terminal cleavage/methylation domain-containing protein